eukprot:TRINITY_DN2418_c0_g2_i1.p2 TRINITY_DN2418_c0_g2~~TRINITY_DN2418_c0_g2_i1.p2  ORF type:complete len:52 (-),score=2.92 TRINITY_DN2418_c0_g2_i1:228-383(-)
MEFDTCTCCSTVGSQSVTLVALILSGIVIPVHVCINSVLKRVVFFATKAHG